MTTHGSPRGMKIQRVGLSSIFRRAFSEQKRVRQYFPGTLRDAFAVHGIKTWPSEFF